MSLHILDIAENSVNAGATEISIRVEENSGLDRLEISVEDDGRGMDIEKKASDRFYTEKSGKRFGLGLPLLGQAAEESGGGMSIGPAGQKGVSVRAWFRMSHIDLKPLGDMGSTMSALVGGHPEIRYSFRYRKDGDSYELDTEELKHNLGGAAINIPLVLKFIREDVNDAIRRIRG